jgi:hypothetical protein
MALKEEFKLRATALIFSSTGSKNETPLEYINLVIIKMLLANLFIFLHYEKSSSNW